MSESTESAAPAEETPEAAAADAAPAEPTEAPEQVVQVARPGSGRRSLLLGGATAAAALVVGGVGGYFIGRPPGTGYDTEHEDPAHPSFKYGGEKGPDHWGELSPLTKACGSGTLQSPVDISGRRLQQVTWLEPLKIEYKATTARLLNTGYTFQVNYDKGSTLSFLGAEFELLQFHFHTPGEHTVDGRPSDMELHLVHERKGAPDQLAVLGVFVNAGAENGLFAKVWDQMPDKPTKEKPASEIKTKISLNLVETLPQDRDYWTYGGSLTTPPCAEKVTWFVLKRPIQASRAQISRFTEVVGKNARPVQPLYDRYILERMPPTA